MLATYASGQCLPVLHVAVTPESYGDANRQIFASALSRVLGDAHRASATTAGDFHTVFPRRTDGETDEVEKSTLQMFQPLQKQLWCLPPLANCSPFPNPVVPINHLFRHVTTPRRPCLYHPEMRNVVPINLISSCNYAP